MREVNLRHLFVLIGSFSLLWISTMMASQLPGAKGSEIKHEEQGPAMEDMNLDNEYPVHRRDSTPSKHRGYMYQNRIQNASESQSEQ